MFAYYQNVRQVGYDYELIDEPCIGEFDEDRFISDFNSYPNWLNYYESIDKDLERLFVDNILRYMTEMPKLAWIYFHGPTKVSVRLLSDNENRMIKDARHEYNGIRWVEISVKKLSTKPSLWNAYVSDYRVMAFIPSLIQ